MGEHTITSRSTLRCAAEQTDPTDSRRRHYNHTAAANALLSLAYDRSFLGSLKSRRIAHLRWACLFVLAGATGSHELGTLSCAAWHRTLGGL